VLLPLLLLLCVVAVGPSPRPAGPAGPAGPPPPPPTGAGLRASVPTRLRSVVLVAVVLVAADLAGATNPAIDIRVAPFAPEESKKNEGGSCPIGRSF
jgi:hypothetical protein